MRIGLTCLLAAGLAFAQDSAEVERHFDLALQMSIDGKDAEAIPEYRKVLELMPDLYEAHINLGQVLLRSKNPTEALPHLKRAHEQKPTEFRPAYYFAEALFDPGQFAEAIPPYTAAVAADAKNAPAELGLGRTLVRLDKRAEATSHYRKAVELDPQLKSFLLELAQAHEDKGEVDAAVAIFKEFPENPGAVEHLGLLALKAGQDKEAIAALEVAVKASRPLPTGSHWRRLMSETKTSRRPSRCSRRWTIKHLTRKCFMHGFCGISARSRNPPNSSTKRRN